MTDANKVTTRIEYFYDAAGNPLRTEFNGAKTTTNTDAANQITSKVGPNGTVRFTYDADGNLSSETNPDGSGKTYAFDGRDQLIAVEVKSAGGALSKRSEFVYDGMGRLMKSVEFTRSGTTWVKQSETNRVFDGMDTVQERGDNNALLAQLTRDGNIGGILSRKAGAVTSFFGYDGNGNVALLSDANGNSVGRYRYDGFGNALEVTGSAAVENEHRFSTKELHAPSGLYYYGFRFYSPALGRWISRDPIREAGGVNLYQMVENDAVNSVDEYGLITLKERDSAVREALKAGYTVREQKGHKLCQKPGCKDVKIPGVHRGDKDDGHLKRALADIRAEQAKVNREKKEKEKKEKEETDNFMADCYRLGLVYGPPTMSQYSKQSKAKARAHYDALIKATANAERLRLEHAVVNPGMSGYGIGSGVDPLGQPNAGFVPNLNPGYVH